MTDRADTQEDVVLKACGIRKVFRSGADELEVLKGVSLEVRRGEMIAITGASGVGKSTLLHILGTLDRPTEGELEINAEDVLALDGDSLARFRNRNIGFVFQFHNLLPEFTALENVMLPGMIGSRPMDGVRDKAMELLTMVGLEERFEHRPGELSGGECQRVAVVRALAMNPLVVFADEPSGNLDAAASNALHEMIVELSRAEKQTFMVMTHDQNLARSLDRTGHIEAGLLHLS
jgi:lipoprotein-releasing system ATP-binding protein